MPFGIKELKNLQVLSNFIVGTGTRSSGLKDLKRLTLLNGELCISRLENVNDPREAKEAALWEKKNLETLALLWRSKFDSSRREVLEESVLDVLKPYPNIKKLTIMCYGGQRFPSWIGDPSFSVIEVLKLENCENCTSLPSLGLLSSLKHLTVKGLTKLKSIGIEVYGKDCSKSFQSLKILRFENLPEWEHWDTEFKEIGLVAGFSSLRQLSIVMNLFCYRIGLKIDVNCTTRMGSLVLLSAILRKIELSAQCTATVVQTSNSRFIDIRYCTALFCCRVIDDNLLIKNLVKANNSKCLSEGMMRSCEQNLGISILMAIWKSLLRKNYSCIS
ncbi:hypothetical protein WN943_015760 [Citrus x changshan-huyou]